MLDFYKNIICSSIGIITAETLTLPICTAKTISQTKGLSPLSSFIYIKNIQGIKGFYNSWGYAITSQLFSLTTKYSFYYLIKDKISEYDILQPNTYVSNTIVGLLSGCISNFFSHPFDYFKIQKQQGKKLSELDFRVYRGFSKSMLKSMALTSTIFPIFDFYKKYMNVISASCLTSFTITAVLHPIDFLKVRHISNLALYEKNILYYYRSFSLNLLRCVPHFMIVMTVTSISKNYLNNFFILDHRLLQLFYMIILY